MTNENTETGWTALLSIYGSSTPVTSDLASLPHPFDRTPEGARRIDALSPYRQLLPGAPRPAFLIMSGATDYTIPLWVGGKFVAAARAANKDAPPVLWRIDWTGGHNAGRDYAAEDADLMSFMFWRLGHPGFQPRN